MKLVRNAVYGLETSVGRIQVFHVANNGHIQIAMYRDARGACQPGYSGEVRMIFSMIQGQADRINNHDHWIEDLKREGVMVASHVIDALKLTSRDYREMARKAAKKLNITNC